MSNDKKKVLIICNSLQSGGAEKYSVTLFNEFNRLGHDAWLVYLRPISTLEGLLDESFRDKVLCAKRDRYLDPKAYRMIRCLIVEQGIKNIVTVNQCPLSYGLWLKAAIPRLNVLATFHTIKMPLKESFKFWLTGWFLFKLANKVVYVCDRQKQYWASRFLHLANRAVRIYNGIPVSLDRVNVEESSIRSHFDIPESAFLMVSVAMLRPEKQQIEMVRCLARMREKGLDCYLMLVGDGPMRSQIIEEAVRLGVQGYLKLAGWVPEVQNYVAVSDCALMLSSQETFSIAVLETLVMGCRVVGFDEGGFSEQVTKENHGYVITQRNQESLDSAISKIYETPSDDRLRRDLFSHVKENFSLDSMMSQYEQLLL